MFRVTRYPMISKNDSGRVGYQKKYRVAGRVRVPAGHCPWGLVKFHDHDDDDDDGDDDDEDDDDEGDDDYDDDSPLQPPFIPSHEDSVGIAPPAPTPWLLSYLTVLPKS